MDSGLLSLKWNNHVTTFFHVLETIRKKELYCDVTIACDGKYFAVHKLVLSTCSDYFSEIFDKTQCKHPIIVLKDISSVDFDRLLNYMYVGEVNVLQNELSSLIKAAECLRVKGLAIPDDPPPSSSTSSKRSTKRSSNSTDREPVANKKTRNVNNSSPVFNENSQSSSSALESREPSRHADGQDNCDIEEIVPIKTESDPLDSVEAMEDETFVKSEKLEADPIESQAGVAEFDDGSGSTSGFLGQMGQASADPNVPAVSYDDSMNWGDVEGVDDDRGGDDLAGFDSANFLSAQARSQMVPPFNAPVEASEHDTASSRYMEKDGLVWKCVYMNCNYQTKVKCNMVRHVRVHTGERPHKCPHCDYSSKDPSNLNKHMVRHKPRFGPDSLNFPPSLNMSSLGLNITGCLPRFPTDNSDLAKF